MTTLAVQLGREEPVGITPSLQESASPSARGAVYTRPPRLVKTAAACMAPQAALCFNNSLEDPQTSLEAVTLMAVLR